MKFRILRGLNVFGIVAKNLTGVSKKSLQKVLVHKMSEEPTVKSVYLCAKIQIYKIVFCFIEFLFFNFSFVKFTK